VRGEEAARVTKYDSLEVSLTVRDQIEARAQHPDLAERTFLLEGKRAWTYAEFRERSVRMAQLFRTRLGATDAGKPGRVGLLLENCLEFSSIFGGCAYAGLGLFALNSSLRGETLAGLINQSRAPLLIVGEALLPEIDRIIGRLRNVHPENVLVLPDAGEGLGAYSNLQACLESETPREPTPPEVRVTPETDLVVLYTSGTTGLPKGIKNSHYKLCMTGRNVSALLDLQPEDTGYICMPLFHSATLFGAFMSGFWAGSRIVVRERFSASAFVPEVLQYGVTYWTYIGEIVHYVLAEIEKAYGRDPERIRDELTRNPRNKLRIALGAGASPPDIDRFLEWLGLEDMFETYSSTEATISTSRRRGDPRGSAGEILDPAVRILDEAGRECPPARLDRAGRITNYASVVGEICRAGSDAGLFQGYFENPEADATKLRDGIFHSGDLGHIGIHDGRRYLYFDGRTEDWIRKDGENFSAAPIARLISEHPDIPLAAAYGVPCSVSDELVMVAIKLRPGSRFDPEEFFDFCQEQVAEGRMDPKWRPDFVRIVDDFEYTRTQKILVRKLRSEHFDRNRIHDPRIYWRERGDTCFKRFAAADLERLRDRFSAAERLHLLEGQQAQSRPANPD
jgi:fatty-acyl-CoA synthase